MSISIQDVTPSERPATPKDRQWRRDTEADAMVGRSPELPALLEQYGCGPVRFTGAADALYERHLVFDKVMDLSAIGARERFEAVAHSARDILSQRWIKILQKG